MATSVVLAAAALLFALAAAAARRERAVLGHLCNTWSGDGGRPVILTCQSLGKRLDGLYLFYRGHARRVWNGFQCPLRGGGDLLAFCMAADLSFGHPHQRRRWFMVSVTMPMETGRVLVPLEPLQATGPYEAYVPRPRATGVWHAPHQPEHPGAVQKLLAAVSQAGPRTGAELKDRMLVLWQPYRHSPAQCERLVRLGLDLCRSLREEDAAAVGTAPAAENDERSH